MADSHFRVAFLADTQLGMYATFSGMGPDQVARYAAVDMRVEPVPRVEGFEWDARRYERAVAAVNGLRPDLVIVGGDMIDESNSDEQTEAFLGITSRLDPAIPVRYAPGNHDLAPDTLVPTPEGIARYREVFGPDYYVFSEGPATFVVLNTVVIDHPEMVPEAWAAQQVFIDDALAALPGNRRAVMIGHHPLFIRHPDEPDTYWNLPLERRRPLYEALRRAGVRIALAGHWHRNNVSVDDGFEMITSGPVGYPLGSDPSGFRIVDVFADRVTHEYIPLPE